MEKVTNYDIVSALTASDLADIVTLRIKRGWIPIGGVAGDKNGFYQALIFKR